MIVVEEGTATVSFASSGTSLHLNVGTKLRYVGQESGVNVVRLENKEIWSRVDSADVIYDLINYRILPSRNTVFNVSKNNLFTTITVLDGMVTIQDETYSGEVTTGQQIQIQSFKTLEESFASVGLVSSDFRSSDWYTLNNGSQFEGTPSDTDASSSTTASSSGSPLLFEFPQDEATVEASGVNVKGRILSSLVARININGQSAQIDYTTNSFSFEEIELTQKENNLVYRVYSSAGDLMYKGVLTVYLSQAPSQSGASSTSSLANVDSFPEARSGYRVTSPAADYYTTAENVVRIDGVVPAGEVSYIKINDFQLSKFVPGGTDWYYFANAQFGNLNEGTNLYEIQYYDDEDVVVHKQLFIIKKVPASELSTSTQASADEESSDA